MRATLARNVRLNIRLHIRGFEDPNVSRLEIYSGDHDYNDDDDAYGDDNDSGYCLDDDDGDDDDEGGDDDDDDDDDHENDDDDGDNDGHPRRKLRPRRR